ncbi:MAG: thioredoxin family protein [Candidatus Dormibacteria bacterium]|jgi:thioredoxin 1
MIDAVTDASFDAEVVASSLPVLVEFGASWCPPCRAMAPVLAEIAGKLRGRLRVVAVDSDANPSTAGHLGVMAVPTLILFAGGRPIRRVTGYASRPKLLRIVDEALAEVVPAP